MYVQLCHVDLLACPPTQTCTTSASLPKYITYSITSRSLAVHPRAAQTAIPGVVDFDSSACTLAFGSDRKRDENREQCGDQVLHLMYVCTNVCMFLCMCLCRYTQIELCSNQDRRMDMIGRQVESQSRGEYIFLAKAALKTRTR